MNSNFKLIEKKNLWFTISASVILIGAILMMTRAFRSEPVLNYGIDFVGGSNMILKFDELNQQHAMAKEQNLPSDQININFMAKLRKVLAENGLEKSAIQITNDLEVLIKTHLLNNKDSQTIRKNLNKDLGPLEVLEIDFIGPTIGLELRQKSIWILLVVSVALLIYITWRFEFAFGLAALVALIHDALITLSFSSIFMIEINTAFVAALLAVLGYSINDTIVIFDRIRENFIHEKEKFPIIFLANKALRQTLVRTLNTSITTLIVISSLLIFGGTTIKSFCLVLLIGVVAGTYSSLFIASPTLILLQPKEKPVQ